MYRKSNINASQRRGKKSSVSLMAEKGQNIRDLSQLLDATFAQKIQNLTIDAAGQLIKRGGAKKKAEISSITGFSLFKHFYGLIFIVGYGTTVSAVDFSDGTEQIIKNDFSEFAPTSGKTYGNYFIIGSGGTEKVGRISKTLDYNTQTANFTVGSVVTGGTSGATATILEDADAGTSGTLTLGNIVGTFQNGEIITDAVTGSATTAGVVTHVYVEITAAPIAKIVEIATTGTSLDARCLVGNLRPTTTDDKIDSNTFQSSDVDDGTNPPFETWTIGVNAGNGFRIFNKKRGELRTISSIGQQIVVGYENGRIGFRISTLEINSVKEQEVTYDFDNKQAGMLENAIETKTGVFAANQSKLLQLISGGATNVPFSEQEKNISDVLGDDYFDDVNFDNLDIIEDTKRKLIWYTFGKDSDTNNLVLAYNTETESFVEFTWNINRFTKINDVIYGASSIDGRLYELFSGSDDDGDPIPVDYRQELNFGKLKGLWDIEEFVIQAILGEGAEYCVSMDTWDRNANFTSGVVQMLMAGTTPLSTMKGWGSASWGTAGWGSGIAGTIQGSTPYHNRDIGLKDFWRVSVRITSNDKLPARINFFQATVVDREENLLLNNLPFKT